MTLKEYAKKISIIAKAHPNLKVVYAINVAIVIYNVYKIVRILSK